MYPHFFYNPRTPSQRDENYLTIQSPRENFLPATGYLLTLQRSFLQVKFMNFISFLFFQKKEEPFWLHLFFNVVYHDCSHGYSSYLFRLPRFTKQTTSPPLWVTSIQKNPKQWVTSPQDSSTPPVIVTSQF